MEIRTLDGDAPETIATLLPGFAETMKLALPSDPPVTAALLSRLFQRRHGTDRIVLAAYDGDQPAGVVKLGLDLTDPRGPGHGSLWVFPGFRRRGAGRALAEAARAELRSRGRGDLLVDAPHGEEAERFAGALGAKQISRTARNRLMLNESARDALKDLARPVQGYRLRRWTGACPEDLVASYASAWGRLDQNVNGRARPNDPQPDDVRAREAEAVRAGHREHVVAVLRDKDDQVVAYGTLFVRDSPMADVGETVVLPHLRRRGIGLWLKAELLLTAAQENERLALVQVFNDTTNTAVLGLNAKLGFKTDSHWTTYSLET
ncbi:GNAT family N-acetyltransferase [Actinomadura sp. 3N508]|uniref:GNAT family N-acetyltransferase n=1 Tax=Actinomadura sp. 3N508 TaxID=3375153 RepID=UPI0037910922